MNCYVCYQEWSFSCYLTRVTTLGFSVLAIFLGRFFGFCTEKLRFLGFVGGCGFRFFGFLAPGFLAKIKQVRFLSGSLRIPNVRLFYMFLFYCQSRSNCNVGFWIFDQRSTVGCTRLSLGQCRWAKKVNEKRKKHGSSENVSERKTAGREKGRACSISLNTSIRPLPRPPRLNIICKGGFARVRGLNCFPRWRSRFHI